MELPDGIVHRDQQRTQKAETRAYQPNIRSQAEEREPAQEMGPEQVGAVAETIINVMSKVQSETKGARRRTL